jgi:hypothetical protein
MHGHFFTGFSRKGLAARQTIDPDQIQVTTMGPLGHVYLPPYLRDDDRRKAQAATLATRANVPMVCYAIGREVRAASAQGNFNLLDAKARLLGADHPFLDQAAEDLAQTCRHPDAGDLVISGWRPGLRPLTFAVETGAHGGPGIKETQGFIMFQRGADVGQGVVRPSDLRNLVIDRMGRKPEMNEIQNR